MKRVLLALLLALVLAVPASARSYSPMQIVSEGLTGCGYECNLYDGVLGSDETLEWMAQGDLMPGESYTYTYQPTSGPREISAYAGNRIGRQANLRVVIRATLLEVGELYTEGIGRACLYWYWSQAPNSPWSVTITNPDTKTARSVQFQGRNQMQIGESCVGF